MGRHKQPASLSGLRTDAMPWLLEQEDPCVRYRTVTELLDRPQDDREGARRVLA